MNLPTSLASLAPTPQTVAETKEPAKVLPKSPLPITLGADLLRLGVLATVCTCAALVCNQLREESLPLVYASKQARIEQAVDRTTAAEPAPDAAQPSTPGEAPRVIDLAEFRNLVQSKHGVVLDARPEIFHRLGHVPGALSLSREEFEQDYATERSFLEARREEPLAVYCSSASCEDSQMVADALAKLGYQHVLVFKGGWDAWTQAGLAEEKR